ncbi:MAG: DEAD/DEAH box helicase [Deltaproteobacteria bacterium]|nr:DEAD/DEAH box helicase [Deltaproteobacteria bacterium]
MSPLDRFGEATRAWFRQSFDAPTEVQCRGWDVIGSGAHALLIAPTGSGKTLAAFLSAIDGLLCLGPAERPGVRVLYVSPLKALVYDVERNLRAPLTGIRTAATARGDRPRDLRVAVRTGDTPARERQRQIRHPADLLVTTPESLFLLLSSRARETLAAVETVIVDEVHALAGTKRGAHLALSLERLAEATGRDPQRVGLSATVRPPEEVARFLGGARPVQIVDASAAPLLDLRVVVPVPDMQNVPTPLPSPRPPSGRGAAGLHGRQAPGASGERGLWAALYPALLDEVRSHRSTIVFVNSRGLCERLTQRLNELAGEELVRAHHGSVARERRLEIEEGLKQGTVRGIVATSSLELGIDMGSVDQVVLVESPGSVSRGLQRVGRAGHQVGAVSVGRIYPKFRADLLECAVVAGGMVRGEIEALQVPRNPLDVLAQQVVALCCEHARSPDEILRLTRRAYPFQDLSEAALRAVLDLLSGRYPSTELADLRPLLTWDRGRDVLTARSGAALVLRANAGTIPDRGSFTVHLGSGGPRLGELDEEMVFETRSGDNILLGASTWRVEEITRDRILVSPAPGEPGRLPFWHGEGTGRPAELGRALGAFVREAGSRPRADAVRWLAEHAPLDSRAAENLAAYLFEQKEHVGALPTDRCVTVERFRDEFGDWRVCILTPFGARIHAPWALALESVLGRRVGLEVSVMSTDDGLLLRLADTEDAPGNELLVPDPSEVEALVTDQLGRSALFAGLFRENAARSLLLPRRRVGHRTPLWAQRLKAQNLLAAVRRHPDFPIVLETYRQILRDVFDLAGLKELLSNVQRGNVALVNVETGSASPFARSLVFAHAAAAVYAPDAPLAERKAQALTLDRHLLAELLGETQLRELLDPRVLTDLESELQHLSPGRRTRSFDELHDLLRQLGDLAPAEVAERCDGEPGPWLRQLRAEGRAAPVAVAGETRWVTDEDAPLYLTLSQACRPGAAPGPLEPLLRRYARTRGPFRTQDAAQRLGAPATAVEPVLRALEADGTLFRGEIRPGGVEPEWCDADVLRRLRQRTVAHLRRQAAPVDRATLASFLLDWQRVGRDPSGVDPLDAAVTRLEGLPLPWSELVGTILPQRVPSLAAQDLDLLAASGRIVWVGRGSLGPGEGRVALYHRDHAGALVPPPSPNVPLGPLHEALLDHLERRGASFLVELEAAASGACPGATPGDVHAAVWDLVWAGHLTNDTFAPLRSLRRHAGPPTGGRRRGLALAGGRWSRVQDFLARAVDPTERAVAWAGALLERYGVVSREAAIAEEVPGGFGPLYQALKAMEAAGRVRRGYFVEGLSGAQFAAPGAVERLRGARLTTEEDRPQDDRDVRWLAALDPANPYGALLPWPETAHPAAARARRRSGAWVVLVAGRPALFVHPGARALTTFSDAAADRRFLELAFGALGRLPLVERRLLTIETIDGVLVRESSYVEALMRCGFESDYRGLVRVRAA